MEFVMKIETAIKILEQERQFLGMGFLEVLQDIQKHGKMIYSQKTVEAYERFMIDGRKMFAPVGEE
jgi:DNA-directed RNA polymerase delta subunit